MKLNEQVLRDNKQQHTQILSKILRKEYNFGNNKEALDKYQILGRELVLIYSGFKCEKCGCSNNLTIHHMITRDNKQFVPFFKYYAQRNYFNSLVVLCKSHHNELHPKAKLKKMKAIPTKTLQEIKDKYYIKEELINENIPIKVEG